MKHQLLQLFSTVLILSYASFSSASDNSASVLPAEGNKQCSDYAANSTILQMGTNSPLADGKLSGADNPQDVDFTGESALYSVADGKVMSFSSSTTPIDYALLKSGKGVSVIIYPSGGVTYDANMRLTVAGVDQAITGISLCYGLGNVAPPLPPPTTLKSCNTSAILDATGVSCPTSTERTLVCNFELDKPFYGLRDGSDSCCVCNSEPLIECDPNVVAGSPNACIAETTTKTGAEVTTHLELNNDPYVCTTSGSGPRICYAY